MCEESDTDPVQRTTGTVNLDGERLSCDTTTTVTLAYVQCWLPPATVNSQGHYKVTCCTHYSDLLASNAGWAFHLVLDVLEYLWSTQVVVIIVV